MASISYKCKDAAITVQANANMSYVILEDVKKIISATVLYTESAYYLKPAITINGNAINILCSPYAIAQTINIRFMYM